MSGREAAVVGAVVVVLMLAIAVFDEWRGPIQWLSRLAFTSLLAFFLGRALWRWWRVQSAAANEHAAGVALAIAAIGWLDVGLAKAVMGISENNYALIIIAPLMMMLGAVVSLGGLAASALAAAAFSKTLTSKAPRVGVLLGGFAAIVLNLGHIVVLFRTLERR